jgi:hypothetical protein
MTADVNVAETKTSEQVKSIPAQQNQVATPTEQETPDQINWKKFREQREIDRKQKDEATKRALEKEAEAQALKAALEAIVNKPNINQNNEMPEETEDDRIQKKIEAALAKERHRVAEENKQREAQDLPNKIQMNLKDFDKVCSSQNIDYLEYHYPEVTAGYKHMPESYEKWNAVYHAVKKLVPNSDQKKEAARADQNLNKPQAFNSNNNLQGAMPNKGAVHLTDERRAQNWERMRKELNKLS